MTHPPKHPVLEEIAAWLLVAVALVVLGVGCHAVFHAVWHSIRTQ